MFPEPCKHLAFSFVLVMWVNLCFGFPAFELRRNWFLFSGHFLPFYSQHASNLRHLNLFSCPTKDESSPTFSLIPRCFPYFLLTSFASHSLIVSFWMRISWSSFSFFNCRSFWVSPSYQRWQLIRHWIKGEFILSVIFRTLSFSTFESNAHDLLSSRAICSRKR